MSRFSFLKPDFSRFSGFSLFRTRPDPVAALYCDIVAAARAPIAFLAFGVRDDFEGRFERLVLVATLVLRRLKALPPPADAIAQQLVDRIFAGLDDGLRQSGVSDVAVGKKMKKLAQGFYGRAEAYTAALDEPLNLAEPSNLAAPPNLALKEVLARNLLCGRLAPDQIAPGLVDDVLALTARLDRASLDTLLAGGVLNSHYSGLPPSSRA